MHSSFLPSKMHENVSYLDFHLLGISQRGRMPRDYPLPSLLHAEYFLLEIRTTARQNNGIYQLKTLAESQKSWVSEE